MCGGHVRRFFLIGRPPDFARDLVHPPRAQDYHLDGSTRHFYPAAGTFSRGGADARGPLPRPDVESDRPRRRGIVPVAIQPSPSFLYLGSRGVSPPLGEIRFSVFLYPSPVRGESLLPLLADEFRVKYRMAAFLFSLSHTCRVGNGTRSDLEARDRRRKKRRHALRAAVARDR